MPKAILRFNLPDENEEFKYAQNGVQYAIVVEEMHQYLRAKLKYEDLSEDHYKIYESIRTKLYELMNDRGLSE